MTTPNSLAVIPTTAELVRQSTDVAGACREIVLRTARKIGDKNFVPVEGWMAIATAHGCLASARDVERVEGGYKCTGEIRRMSDGATLASAEGFVGEDEPTWFGGESEVWDKYAKKRVTKTLPKRHDYAIRAMCQTRAISRACRSAFAHVVVLMDAGLSTTPAEEVPSGGFQEDHGAREDGPREKTARQANAAQRTEKPAGGHPDAKADGFTRWQDVECHFGKNTGLSLGKMNDKQRQFYFEHFEKGPKPGRSFSHDDKKMIVALELWKAGGEQRQPAPDAGSEEDDNLYTIGEALNEANISSETFIAVVSAQGICDSLTFEGMSPEETKRIVAILPQVIEACKKEAKK